MFKVQNRGIDTVTVKRKKANIAAKMLCQTAVRSNPNIKLNAQSQVRWQFQTDHHIKIGFPFSVDNLLSAINITITISFHPAYIPKMDEDNRQMAVLIC